MIRVVEIVLFLAPLALFVIWRLLMPQSEITRRHIVALGVGLAAMLALLVWLRQQDAEPPNASYVPAQLHGGVITPPQSRP